jgi:hypothetical protein
VAFCSHYFANCHSDESRSVLSRVLKASRPIISCQLLPLLSRMLTFTASRYQPAHSCQSACSPRMGQKSATGVNL